MKTKLFVFLSLICVVSLQANLLTDPSLEDPLTFDGPPFVGSWEGFSAGAPSIAESSSDNPRTGGQGVKLTIGASNHFAGFFQDVPVLPGEDYVYSGYHANAYAGVEVRIEWQDAGNTEISRTQITPSAAGAAYEMFTLNDTAPAGAVNARVVYAIQSFGGAGNGMVFADDFSFTQVGGNVPDSGSTALALGVTFLLGCLGMRLGFFQFRKPSSC